MKQPTFFPNTSARDRIDALMKRFDLLIHRPELKPPEQPHEETSPKEYPKLRLVK